ncbi:MAG: glycerophosphodiester phosphodiesterase [Pseudomonadota bacterium]
MTTATLKSRRSVAKRPILIAHRGASGYLPEHSLAAKAAAYFMGADYLEQDVVASKDDELVVLHDIYLDKITDVRQRFPDRCRKDGRYYARDFLLAELQQLNLTERLNETFDAAHYPGRFPPERCRFGIVTLREELQFIAGLNRSTGRQAGIYTEIKRPLWHREQGVELGDLVVATLDEFGYKDAADAAYIQCFDSQELRRLKDTWQLALPLVQLIGDNSWNEAPEDFDLLRSPTGLATLAKTVDAIGPWFEQLSEHGQAITDKKPALMEIAHSEGLSVHPFTFRSDDLGEGFDSFEAQLRWAVEIAQIDGFFTDFPDRASQLLDTIAYGEPGRAAGSLDR